MKFLYKDSKRKNISDEIILDDYCENEANLPIDGAYAKINGSLGPKVNKSFSELFFIISGTLLIEQDGITHELKEKDMYIIHPNTKHKILGKKCEAFISCSPQFKANDVEYCD